MKKKFLFIIILIFFTATSGYSQLYQYQYFNKKHKHLPFSDYIPQIRLYNFTHPRYVEDFYVLYGMKLYYNENSLRKNIEKLKIGLSTKFRHPSKALVEVSTKKEYLKYRKLLFMHINLMIMRSYLKIATRYDMVRVKFYHKEFKKDILKSLNIAEETYKQAIPYWKIAKKLAKEASKIKITTNLSNIESERFSIKTGDLDFKKIIKAHLKRIKKKRKLLNKY